MFSNPLFIVFLLIFIATAIITLLGITNVIKNIKDKFLTALFTALILEVVASIIFMFNSQIKNDRTFPDQFYGKTSIKKSDNYKKDSDSFLELILKGERYDSDLKNQKSKIDSLSTALEKYTKENSFLLLSKKLKLTEEIDCNSTILGCNESRAYLKYEKIENDVSFLYTDLDWDGGDFSVIEIKENKKTLRYKGGDKTFEVNITKQHDEDNSLLIEIFKL